VEAPVIVDLPSTLLPTVNAKLVQMRQEGGAVTLGRVLTLVIVTDDGPRTEEAIDAANAASREHPCRVIVVAKGTKKAAPRLDAQIRVGGDAGASEVVVLRLYGALADEGASCVIPLLLPDTPVVVWWPFEAPAVPSKDQIGELANRRITDSANERNPVRAMEQRRVSYVPGDTDLAWTRLTKWRAMLAAALDLPPYEKVTAAAVTGEADSPSTELLAAWLATCLKIPVSRYKATSGEGIVKVVLERRSGTVELVRPDAKVGTLTQPGQPPRKMALHRRSVQECLSEELRRLDPDEIYAETLKGLAKVVKGRGSGTAPAKTKPSAKKANAEAVPEGPADSEPASKSTVARRAKPKPAAAAASAAAARSTTSAARSTTSATSARSAAGSGRKAKAAEPVQS
jgi:glucose-6-phosphate dehydrogenase assembly protein OpcA